MKITTYRLPGSDSVTCEFTGRVRGGVLTIEKIESGELLPGYFLGDPSDGYRLSQDPNGTWLVSGEPKDIKKGSPLKAWNREVYSMAGGSDDRVPPGALDVTTIESAMPENPAPVPAWGFDLSGAP